MTLAALIARSRVHALRTAVVATIAAQISGCEVRSHPGRLDVSDLEEMPFATPSINVGVVRIAPAEGRLSGHRDVPVEVGAYVVTRDQVLGGRLVLRDEIGLALCDGILAIVEDVRLSQWDLGDLGFPEAAEARPLFTAVRKDAVAFYAVTWRQVLYGLGQPFMDLDGSVPAGAAARVVLPGDPDWLPGGVP